MRPEYDDGTVSVYHATHAALAEHLRETGVRPDACVVDAPYSERTHAGHDDGTASANRSSAWVPSNPARAARASRSEIDGTAVRRGIDYAAWSGDAVAEFVDAWTRTVRGWIVSLTDHVLAREWEAELDAAGRYVFSPLACVESGSRVRLGGDGPAQWSTWAVVARPRTAEFHGWGSLPGAYVDTSERKPWVGGKPVWLIRALVRDYSRPGDLIVDPTCGAGTLGVAVRYEGRRAILGDQDPAAVETTIKRLRGERTKPTSADLPGDADHALALFRGEAAE